MELCGQDALVTDAEMINKTLITFPHHANMLAEIYHNMRFTKYSDLLSILLQAEQREDIRLNNDDNRTTNSPAQTHHTQTKVQEPTHNNRNHSRGRGHSRGHGRGRGRGNNHRHNNNKSDQ